MIPKFLLGDFYLDPMYYFLEGSLYVISTTLLKL